MLLTLAFLLVFTWGSSTMQHEVQCVQVVQHASSIGLDSRLHSGRHLAHSAGHWHAGAAAPRVWRSQE